MEERATVSNRALYKVKRQTYSNSDFYSEYTPIQKKTISVTKIKYGCKNIRLKSFGFACLPCLFSLREFYSLKCFMMDIISGLTMAIFHIPQGMAYGVLAGLSPVNGLYTSFFPVLAYVVFGTSRHMSIGTFSLASLLYSSPINRLANQYVSQTNGSNATSAFVDHDAFRLQIGILLTFMIGVCQIIMGIFQLGFLVTYLSGPLISGFMCASSFHIFASQMCDLLGIKIPNYYGPGNLLLKFYAAFQRLPRVNWPTVIISIICIIVLFIFRNLINPRFRKKFKFPIPIEIVIVATTTVASSFGNFSTKYHVKTVGEIPQGLPTPTLPNFDYVSELLSEIIMISIVTFAISASLVKLYAAEFGYDVLYNQELVALGISNAFGSFFHCIAACGALARSAVVVGVGMTSQVASIVSCAVLLLILYCIGPYLCSLPRAVLASIIVVALTSTFMKVKDIKVLWNVAICDAFIWLVAFLSTLLIDVPYGIILGFVFSVLTVVYRSQYGARDILGSAGETGLYTEITRYEDLKELEGIKVIRFDGPVYFANAESFQNTIYHLSGFDPSKTAHKINHRLFGGLHGASCLPKKHTDEPESGLSQLPTSVTPADQEIGDRTETAVESSRLYFIILDATSWMFIDTVGLRAIRDIVQKYELFGVQFMIAGCRSRLWHNFNNSGTFQILPEERFFVSIHDAVLVAQAEIRSGALAKLNSSSIMHIKDNDSNDDDDDDDDDNYEVDLSFPAGRRQSRF